MRKKPIGILLAVAALALAVAIPVALAQTYAQFPKITPITGKTKLKKKVQVATVSCGSPGTCSTTASKAKVKADGVAYKASVKAGTLGASQSLTAKVKLSKAGFAAVQAAGKGKVKWSMTETGSNGLTANGSGKRKVFVP